MSRALYDQPSGKLDWFLLCDISKKFGNHFEKYRMTFFFNVSKLRMRESYKRFVKTWIRFANPWIRFVLIRQFSKDSIRGFDL